jgi:hypothetical protein
MEKITSTHIPTSIFSRIHIFKKANERKNKQAIARLSLINPELQKTTEGKKRKPMTAAFSAEGLRLAIFLVNNHTLTNAIAEK